MSDSLLDYLLKIAPSTRISHAPILAYPTQHGTTINTLCLYGLKHVNVVNGRLAQNASRAPQPALVRNGAPKLDGWSVGATVGLVCTARWCASPEARPALLLLEKRSTRARVKQK